MNPYEIASLIVLGVGLLAMPFFLRWTERITTDAAARDFERMVPKGIRPLCGVCGKPSQNPWQHSRWCCDCPTHYADTQGGKV
jgi:hypothetical protein